MSNQSDSEEESSTSIPSKITLVLTPWPSTKAQVFGLTVVCLTLLAAGWCFFKEISAGDRDRVLEYVVGNPGNETDRETDRYNLSFWTPDDDTAIDLKDETDGRYAWQKTGSKTRNEEFEERMIEFFNGSKDQNKEKAKELIKGLRRHSITGVGTSKKRKRGQWWSVTVDKNLTPEEFIVFYKMFWDPKSAIYVEASGRSQHFTP